MFYQNRQKNKKPCKTHNNATKYVHKHNKEEEEIKGLIVLKKKENGDGVMLESVTQRCP